MTLALTEGNWVAVTSPDNFLGKKIGIYEGKCKKCSGAKVHLIDDTAPVRNLCIVVDKGDTIEKVSKS